MKITKQLHEKLSTITKAMFDAQGRELLNPIPYQPTGIRPRSMSLRDQIQRALKTELSLQAQSQSFETFEESQDFEIEDSFETKSFNSEYELQEEEFINSDLPSSAEASDIDGPTGPSLSDVPQQAENTKNEPETPQVKPVENEKPIALT